VPFFWRQEIATAFLGMEEIETPIYYIASRKIPPQDAFSIAMALRITPVQCAIISDVLDASLAIELAPSVLRANTDADAMGLAHAIANDTKRPTLVVGEAELLDGIYADGRREAIATQC
jgi:hypothetical protein